MSKAFFRLGNAKKRRLNPVDPVGPVDPIDPVDPVDPVIPGVQKKWFPGHYLIANWYPSTALSANARSLATNNQYIRGYKSHILWNQLETSRDVYNFSVPISQLNVAQSDGKKLLFHIQDKRFGTQENPFLPNYMLTAEFDGGFYAKYEPSQNKYNTYGRTWLRAYQLRWQKLMRELGKAIDGHPALAGIIFTETSGTATGTGQPADFTIEAHIDHIKGSHTNVAIGFPTTPIFQYVNWGFTADQRQDIINHIVKTCKHGIGDPDLINSQPQFADGRDRYFTESRFGQFFTTAGNVKGIAPFCVENQEGYYRNSAKILIDYAVANGVSFVPWSIKYKSASNSYTWDINDALREITLQKGRVNTTPPSNITG
jgi:hypothetical protein